MIKINRLTDYAIVLLAQLADEKKPNTTSQLSEATNLPLAIVRKLMQQLRDGDLVEATQGTRGGYQLSLAADQITLKNILNAIQGDIQLTQCAGANHECQVQCQYHFEKHWQHINGVLNNMLSHISLQQMMQDKPLPITLSNEVTYG